MCLVSSSLRLAKRSCMSFGEVEHLSTKQHCAQGDMNSCGVKVQKVPCAGNASHILTHAVSDREFAEDFRQIK